MSLRVRLLLLIVCGPLLLLAAGALVLAAFTLSFTPLVEQRGALTNAEVRQVEQWIVDNSPARFEDQGVRDLSLTGDQLNLFSAFAMSNVPQLQNVAIDFDISGDQASARASIPQQVGPVTLYLNLHANFAQDQGRARLIELKPVICQSQSRLSALPNGLPATGWHRRARPASSSPKRGTVLWHMN
ncbi:MAG: hypothetical protein KKD00_09590 [Gammaproteobacteria bacterium]|nr:hypothetical protein [Gammaproteobacteria bacterium]